jgi:hypothetical protein
MRVGSDGIGDLIVELAVPDPDGLADVVVCDRDGGVAALEGDALYKVRIR